MVNRGLRSRLPGIYKLSPVERVAEVCRLMDWPADFLEEYAPSRCLNLEQADSMVENAIGSFGIPVGLATNFVIDGESVVVPMAVEEPSIIAGVSKAALLVAQSGGFITSVDKSIMMGQIQVLAINDFDYALDLIETEKDALKQLLNSYCPALVARGGGCTDLTARVLPAQIPLEHEFDKAHMIVEFYVDCCDAMGANIINTLAEKLAPVIIQLVGGRAGIKILSNLSDRRLARSRCTIPFQLLAHDAGNDSGAEIAMKIAESYSFARRDPYRACTHNKGIMNGVDAVALATGNDWRALEAAAHAYAAKDGHYTSLTRCSIDTQHGLLHLSIELPLACGVVGGSTKAHPAVKKSLEILGVFGTSASRLARLIASVGLAQNFAAVLALSGDGIQKGHMKLHAKKSRM